MNNTEVTVKVFNNYLDAVEIIKKYGFQLKEQYDLNDYYYSKYSLEELKAMDYKTLLKNSFILRDIVDDNPKVLLTYKDKVVDNDGVVLSENKSSTKVERLEETIKIFDKAGLTNWCKMTQTIDVFEKDGMEICLQNIIGVGLFIEYEWENNDCSMNSFEKIEIMKQRLDMIGLKLGTDYSVKKVWLKFRKENNLEI